MISNDNAFEAINDFEDLPLVPNKIIAILLDDDSEQAENFWKLLYYSTPDALSKDNLTEDEKLSCIWENQPLENEYHIFNKPLIGSALDTAESQTQLRLYRDTNNPVSGIESLVNIIAIFLTNEKESMVRYKSCLVERTDVMESLFLNVMNGRDIGLGTGVLKFDKRLSRSCGSVLGISNSKSFYGRTLTIALRYMSAETDGGICG